MVRWGLLEESYNPFGSLEKHVKTKLVEELNNIGVPVRSEDIVLTGAPPQYGDYAVPLHEVLRRIKIPREHFVNHIIESLLEKTPLINRATEKNGFLNLRLNYSEYGKLIFTMVTRLKEKYGFNPAREKENILVEYISANPIHPLHVGHLRNAVLGESIARLCEWRGHSVKRHFYVDDVGLQVAYAVFGYKFLRKIDWRKYWRKGDHFIGFVYASTHTLIELIDKRRRLEDAKRRNVEEEVLKLTREIDETMIHVSRLRSQNEEVFDRLLDAISRIKDPGKEVVELNRRFEKGDKEVATLFREVCSIVLEGFIETLNQLKIDFDSWDFESEITLWSGLSKKVIDYLSKTPFLMERDGALYLNGEQVASFYGLKKVFNLPETLDLPPLTLCRADGTTLYTVRDIAYSVWKFTKCGVDRVINVVGVDQKIPQLYLKLALWLLGYRKEAQNLHHFAYEMVRLPGARMSSRKGILITADDLIKESILRALDEVYKRNPGIRKEEAEEIAKKVGLGALKYMLVSSSPTRTITFSWERAFDFEQNSGPFIQYSYVRATSILRKADLDPTKISIENIEPEFKEQLERKLLLLLGEFPQKVAEAADNLRPDLIAGYANEVAKTFNLFYEKCPVLKAPSTTRLSRLLLVYTVATVLKNSLNLLGIDTPSRM